MIEKIILNIIHSDDYTDYLFMTAGLTNRRIVPLLNPSAEDIRRQSDANTKVIRCQGWGREVRPHEHPIVSDHDAGYIRVLTRSYLMEDGSIHSGKAEMVRVVLQEMAAELLLSQQNLREVFRQYFPLFWGRRKSIYADPRLFYAPSGRTECLSPWDDIPLGAILKAMEEDPGTFRLRLGGGCTCGEKPLLIDYEDMYRAHWTLYTWCPV